MGRIQDDERKVHPDCRNASNPYHECSEYCFNIIADAKKRINKSDTGLFFIDTLVIFSNDFFLLKEAIKMREKSIAKNF